MRKIRIVFREIDQNFADFVDLSIHRRNTWKQSRGDTIVRRFLQSIWFNPQMKDGANAPAYNLSKETITDIMILNKNTKAMVHSPDWDTEFFVIVTGFLRGDILAPYMSIFCLDYVLRKPIDLTKENGFVLKKRARAFFFNTKLF